MNGTERIRQSFKPDKIRMLLIGESAPAGGDFFYTHSRMTIYVSQAFESVFNENFDDDLSFLKYFQEKGCYLDDLSLSPVNHMFSGQRKEALKTSVGPLSKRIAEHNPDVIVIIMKKIDRYVREAIKLSKKSCSVYTLPFPGNGHQNKFMSEFSTILRRHLRGKHN